MPALAAHVPDEGGQQFLVYEAEMEISGGPVMGMCEFPELFQGSS